MLATFRIDLLDATVRSKLIHGHLSSISAAIELLMFELYSQSSFSILLKLYITTTFTLNLEENLYT